jgi:hypothetical protein
MLTVKLIADSKVRVRKNYGEKTCKKITIVFAWDIDGSCRHEPRPTE